MLGSWKISTATRELRFAAVKSFFRLMSEEGLVDRDVAAEVVFPERTSGRVEERPVLSDTEVSDAVARIGDQSPGRPPLLHRSHRPRACSSRVKMAVHHPVGGAEQRIAPIDDGATCSASGARFFHRPTRRRCSVPWMGKPQQDLQDMRIIAEALIRFGAMTPAEYFKHIDTHPEDKWGELNMPDGRGHRPIGREAARAFHRLAERQRDIDPESEAIDLETLNRAVREAFVDIFIKKAKPWDEQKWVDRMLNRAMKRVKSERRATTHYLPCVVMHSGHPTEFHVGPVRFIEKTKFFDDYRDKIISDHHAANERRKAKLEQMIAADEYAADQKMSDEESERIDQMVLSWIVDYYGSYTWIAEVTVPPCNEKVSRERSEVTVQAALDVLKLFLGRDGDDLRLGHHRGAPDMTAHLTRDVNGTFEHEIARRGEGAFSDEGWYVDLQQNAGWALAAAGSAIEAYLTPGKTRSAHRDRWLGALNWYGQAVSERAASAQIVKYVAALERLTVLEETETTAACGHQEVTDVVTRRAALLAADVDDPSAIKGLRADARKLYRWRSSLMHGRSSPLTKELLEVMHLAHNMTRDAMFAALSIYVQLDMAGLTAPKDLETEFSEMEKRLLVDPRSESC